MTDHDDPTDDLASAHLDGATTPEEDAAVAGDPALRARVEVLGAARARLRAAADRDSVDPGRREAAIAAALAAFDDAGAAAPADGAGDVVPLAPRPARPAVGGRWRALGIAAAVALVALAVPLLSRLGSDDDDVASSGDTAVESTTSAAREESDAGAAGPTADAAFGAPPSSVPLGSFSSVDELAGAVRVELGQRASAATESAPLAAGDDVSRPQPCAAEVDDLTGAQARTYEGHATLDGTTVVVLVLEDADGARTLVLLDVDDCREVTSRPL